MKLKSAIILVTTFCIAFTTGATYFFSANLLFQEKKVKEKNIEISFKSIEKLSKDGKYNDAASMCEEIIKTALIKDNTQDIIKAVVLKLKYSSAYKEDAGVKAIYDLELLSTKTNGLTQALLQNLLAKSYWGYYTQHRYQFAKRSQTKDHKLNDIRTWDLRKIINACIHNYNEILKNKKDLIAAKTDDYKVLLNGYEYAKELRPTLYDVVMHEIIDFYSSEEVTLTRPLDSFNINNRKYYLDGAQFVKEISASEDSFSFNFQLIKHLQAITTFRLEEKNIPALIDLELKRINTIHEKITLEEKKAYYVKSLETLLGKYNNESYAQQAAVDLATFYTTNANEYIHIDYNIKALDLVKEAIKKTTHKHIITQLQNIEKTITHSHVNISTEDAHSPNTAILARLDYKNTEKIYFKYIKLNAEKYKEAESKEKVLDKDYRQVNANAVKNYVLSQTITKQWTEILPSNKNYLSNRLNYQLPELKNGFYAIVCSANENIDINNNDFWSYTTIQISNYDFLFSNNNKEVIGYLLNRKTGEPMPNEKVEVYYLNQILKKNYLETNAITLKTLTTDKNGYFNYKDQSEQGVKFVVKSKDDQFYANEQFYLNNQEEGVNYQEGTTNSKITTMYTDRVIYRPAQTIYLKGIVVSNEKNKNALVTNESIAVSMYDNNGQVIESKNVSTNKFGSYSTSFVLPKNMLTGNIRLQDNYSSHYVQVEEYKRPKFEIEPIPLQSIYNLNDNIKVEGKVIAFNGAPLKNAKVRYRVTRKTQVPYWWRCYNPWFVDREETEIKSSGTTSNDTGTYIINFIATPDITINKKSAATFTYTSYITVTDINGETHETTQEVTIGYLSTALYANVNDFEIEKNTDTNNIIITTDNLNGVHVPANVVIKIYPLKKPISVFKPNIITFNPNQFLYNREQFYNLFPGEDYLNDRDYKNWEKLDVIENIEVKTTALSHSHKLNTTAYNTGMYIAELFTKDKKEQEVKEIVFFNVTRKAQKIENISAFFIKQKSKTDKKTNYVLYAPFATKAIKSSTEISIDNKQTKINHEWININKGENNFTINSNDSVSGFCHTYTLVNNNAIYLTSTENINYYIKRSITDDFKISIQSFRDKIEPGTKEKYIVKINSKKNTETELLAAMYDKSLDALYPHSWSNIQKGYLLQANTTAPSFYWGKAVSNTTSLNIYFPLDLKSIDAINYPSLNYFDFYFGFAEYGYYNRSLRGDNVRKETMMAQTAMPEAVMQDASKGVALEEANMKSIVVTNENVFLAKNEDAEKDKKIENNTKEQVKIRTNLNETAFFFPQILSKNNEFEINFTMPDALTKWRFMALAHTQNLQESYIEKTVQTQKKLMVEPNWPRFLRLDDEIYLQAKITNLTNTTLNALCTINIINPFTNQKIDFTNELTKTIVLNENSNSIVNFKLNIDKLPDAAQISISAQAGNYSDGEQVVIPVLSNKILVTESLPLPIRSNQTKNFSFDKLLNNKSTTLYNYNFAIEFTQNPAWLAIKALPYLTQNEHDCADVLMQKYFANIIGKQIVNKTPSIKSVIDSWTNTDEATKSNLEKNQELKSVLLNETPWVADAQNEKQNTLTLKEFFNTNKLNNELQNIEEKLLALQLPSGSFSWMQGFKYDNPFITQQVLVTYAKLHAVKSIDVKNNLHKAMSKATIYLDAYYNKQYAVIIKNKIKPKINYISESEINYLWMRYDLKNEFPLNNNFKQMYDFWFTQLKTYWLKQNRYAQGLAAMMLNDNNEQKLAQKIIASLKNTSITNEEMGSYWKDNYEHFYWYQQPIETQAILIQAVSKVTPNDDVFIDNLKTWLLKNKQTRSWINNNATSEAIYTLLFCNNTKAAADWLSTDNNITVKIGDIKLDPNTDNTLQTEKGTGYFKKSYKEENIKNSFGNISVTKTNKGLSWGAAYWQYFEKLEKITPSKTGLAINKNLFVERNTATGPVIVPIVKEKIQLGDKIKVRVEIACDRDFSYVHLKDMRAAGLEPIDVISTYKYQDGLGYYQSTKDVATHFYFQFLPKGTHVFEYSLFATQMGKFESGITTMQSFYAPEFTTHTQSEVVIIK